MSETIIDHVGLSVTDFGRSLAFYAAVLGTLGIRPLLEFEDNGIGRAGFGRSRPDFWIGGGKLYRGEAHVAFVAASRAEVDAFHMAALANGGRDNGRPGLRPHYRPGYYAAFVLDPDGHNIEAVFHGDAT